MDHTPAERLSGKIFTLTFHHLSFRDVAHWEEHWVVRKRLKF